MIDFEHLNLRESRLKRLERNRPAAWKVVMVFSDEHIHTAAEKHYPNDLYYCDKCANGDRSGTGDHGFCVKTTNHRLISATPLFSSSYNKQLMQQQEQEQRQHQHE
jgi:hypothetical protein